MRTLVALAAVSVTLGGSLAIASPASAHGDRERLAEVRQALLAEGDDTPLMSGNVQYLATSPGQAAISGCFLSSAPHFVTSGVDSIRVWDVSDATNPTPVGVLPQALFENEAMNCGERRTGQGTQRFALIGVDAVAAAPTAPEHVNVGGGELRIVDVTDPANPVIRSTAPGTTSTHTVACVDEADCRYAYSAGDSNGKFSIFDLRDLDHPAEVDANPNQAGVQPFTSPTAGHKWNFDAAGFGTHTGWGGSSMWDVSQPPQAGARDHDRRRRPGHRPRVRRLQRLHPPQLVPAQRRQVQAAEQALVRARQRAAGDRGGLRADRLQPGRLVPGLARQAARRDQVGDRAAGQGRAGRPRQLPAAAGDLLLRPLVRLPPQRDRRGGLLRRRNPADRRPEPQAAEVLRLLALGRLGGLGQHVGPRVRRQGAPHRPHQQRPLLDRPGPRPGRLLRRRAR